MNRKLLMGMGVLISLTVGIARVSVAQVISVGETGGGSLPSSIITDPLTGKDGLAYTLPFSVISGDVALTEPSTDADRATSDLVRFVANPQNVDQTLIFFYSDTETVALSDLADIGLPNTQTNLIRIDESGAEGGPNGLLYTPTAGEPGQIAGDGFPTYEFVSDAVPLPPAAWSGLALLGVVVAVSAMRRRKACAA